MTRVRYKDDNLGPIIEGDSLVVKMRAMDGANTGIDEYLRDELRRERLTKMDASLHRPGARYLQYVDDAADAEPQRTTIVHDARGNYRPARRPGFVYDANPYANDEKAIAYYEYEKRICDEYKKPPPPRGSEVGQSCTVNGRAGHLRMVNGELTCVPDQRTDAAPRESTGVCSRCSGSGIEPRHKQTGWLSYGPADDDDDEIEQVVRRASTHHESTQRRQDHVIDGLRKHHVDTMRRIYEEADAELAQLWRGGK